MEKDMLIKLRSLLVDSRYYHTSTLEACLPKLFEQLTCLRILNLSNNNNSALCSFQMLPQEIGKWINFRYLSLEGTVELYELPDAVCDLCNLQTLNIRRCYKLRKLPRGLEKLINLRRLQNAYLNRSLLMPKGMQRFCLQTLEEFRVKKGGVESETSFSLANLRKFIHLRGNVRIEALGNVGDASEAREAQLSTKTGLRALILNFDGDDKEQHTRTEYDAFILEALQPPEHLHSLQIECYKAPEFPFPNWMMTLTSLKSGFLCWCKNCESLPPMGNLPSLESLSILGMEKLKKVGEEFVGVETSSSSSSCVSHNIAFPNLKKLKCRNMIGWEEWEYEKVLRSRGENDSASSSNYISIMPKLVLPSLLYCPALKTLPHHLLQSRALKELEITECPNLFWRFNKERGDDWPSIAHIPTVKNNAMVMK